MTAKFHTVTDWPKKFDKRVLALGPESDGNFCFFDGKKIKISASYGDLLEHKNFAHFRETVLNFLKDNNFHPDIILTDLHPQYVTSVWGKELAEELKTGHGEVQHHLAHVSSTVGDSIISGESLPEKFSGIACDGTGYGSDGKIWGGEVFEFEQEGKLWKRTGHLEEQVLIGGDLAVREPARMLISILSKFLEKKEVYGFVKDYYSANVFELLYNQMKQGFNCETSSSTGRVLDAVSVLLGFSGNKREFKHQPVALLDENSTVPYGLKPQLVEKEGEIIVPTTPLFKYLVENLKKDKNRLAATAQVYLAEGLYQVAKDGEHVFAAGGITKNNLFSRYLSDNGVYLSKEIPRGDAGLSFGQLVFYLLANSGN